MIISVCMSVYVNDDAYAFAQALDSLKRQTTKIDELILVEDGSIGSELLSIIEVYRCSLNIVSLTLERNYGLPFALNKALSLATGDIIVRFDSDDICAPRRIELQVRYLQNHPEIDCVGSWANVVDNTGTIGIKKTPRQVSFADLISSCCLIHPSLTFRVSFFSEFGRYDESLRMSQDWEFWLRAAKKGAVFANIQESLIDLRQVGNFLTRRQREQSFNRMIIKKYDSSALGKVRVLRCYLIQFTPAWILRVVSKILYL